MIEIAPSLFIDESDLAFDFIRSSGPGGQNVNKVATACQLRFDVAHTGALTEEVKARLVKLAGSRMAEGDILVIEAKRYRTQEQNREDAFNRLAALILKAQEAPRERRKTRPSRASQEKRLEEKRRRSGVKRLRRPDAGE